jgi:hypothetical protein
LATGGAEIEQVSGKDKQADAIGIHGYFLQIPLAGWPWPADCNETSVPGASAVRQAGALQVSLYAIAEK